MDTLKISHHEHDTIVDRKELDPLTLPAQEVAAKKSVLFIVNIDWSQLYVYLPEIKSYFHIANRSSE